MDLMWILIQIAKTKTNLCHFDSTGNLPRNLILRIINLFRYDNDILVLFLKSLDHLEVHIEISTREIMTSWILLKSILGEG